MSDSRPRVRAALDKMFGWEIGAAGGITAILTALACALTAAFSR